MTPRISREEEWRKGTEILQSFLSQAGDGKDLFHGTSLSNALKIIEHGFDPARSWVWTPAEGDPPVALPPCVFWTTGPEYGVIAASWNDREGDGGPVVLIAEQDAVLNSGLPTPGLCMWEIETGSDPVDIPFRLAGFPRQAAVDRSDRLPRRPRTHAREGLATRNGCMIH
jgi:hypothetical protein